MSAMVLACGLLAGCRDPLSGPVDLYHDLEGGEIAAERPPPPGAGLPYPKLGTVPAKPTLPDPSFRNGLRAQLQAERDRTERVAADTPVVPLKPPPPPVLPTAPLPAPAAGAGPAQPMVAAATLDTADAPPAKPQPAPPPVAPDSVLPADVGPPPGTPLSIVGVPVATPGLPEVPVAPPSPATFEGVPAEPLPTARVLPAGLSGPPLGTPLFFPDGGTVLPPSQIQALKEFLSHRRKQSIEIIGLGEAASDSPDGQAAAIALALKRAQAVADALAAMHVPQGAMRVGANAFGRGAVVRLE